jgi:hypothetical protein
MAAPLVTGARRDARGRLSQQHTCAAGARIDRFAPSCAHAGASRMRNLRHRVRLAHRTCARAAAAATPSGKPRALISVFDKTGLIELGKARAVSRRTRACVAARCRCRRCTPQPRPSPPRRLRRALTLLRAGARHRA